MSDYNVGDRVRIEKDGEAHEGVVAVEYGAESICQGRYDLPWRESTGWTLTVLEKAAPPLPTEPGFYLTGYDYPDVFELRTSGVWFLGQEIVSEERVRHDGGRNLTRLEPVPVTVQKVIDWLRENYRSATAQAVAEHFGVSS